MLPAESNHNPLPALSYEQALSLKTETHWRELGQISVEAAIRAWLRTLTNKNTRETYTHTFGQLIELKVIDPDISLQQLALSNADAMVDQIKQVDQWAEATRQARAAALLSFYNFLSRRTQGIIRRATPCREGTNKTFFKVREEVATEAMVQGQWIRWLQELGKGSERDLLIARVMLQGGKRVSEVLKLTSDNIDFEKRQITFRQSKTKGLIKETVITYPQTLMDDLRHYIGERDRLVFITREGRQVHRHQIWRSFVRAGQRAGIPVRVTPHVLRASCITFLRKQGINDSDIMKITGHASAEMVAAYDKSSKEDNATKQISLAW